MKPTHRLRFFLLQTAAALALLANHATAGTTWNGNAAATSGNWDAAANWEGAVPTFNATTDLLFRNTSVNNRITSVIQQDRTVRSLTFNSNVTTGFEIRFNVANNNAAKNMTMGDGSNAAAITVHSGAAGNITIGKGGAAATGNLILANNLSVAQNSTSATLTIDAPITESGGARTLTKTGAGTLVLSKTNTYTGNTLVSGGKIVVGNALALQNSAYDTASVNGGLDVTGFTTPTLGGLTGSVNLSSTLITGYGSLSTLTLNPQTGITNTYSGNVGNGNGSMALTKTGAGTQVLSGTNSYSGGTTVSAGTLTLTGANSSSGPVSVQSGGTLSVASVAPSGNQPLGTGTGNISLSGSSTLSITGGGSTSRGLSLSSTGGILNVPAGTVTMSGGITGDTNSAHFTKSGAGTFNYSGSASWSGDFYVTGGTFNLTGGTIAGAGVTTLSNSGTSLRISAAGAMKTASLDIGTGTSVNLEAGTLRVGGGGLGVSDHSITNGGAFNWGNGTLAVYTTGSGEAGQTDRTALAGDTSGPVVREGNYLSVQGSLTNSAGSTLDLGSTYLSNGLRYNQINVSGTLTLNGGTLNIGLNPYFLRPSSPNSVVNGDWGTLILVYAGDITGAFAASGGKTTIPGISSDAIGWTQLVDGSITNPATMPLNTWAIEYRDGTGGFTQAGGDVILLHYKVAGSVPEPGTAGLMIAGGMLLRVLRRRSL